MRDLIGHRSATPVITIPPELFATRIAPFKSSYLRTFTTSWMWVSSPTSGEAKCARSPRPVSVGVKTSCARARRSGVTFFQHANDQSDNGAPRRDARGAAHISSCPTTNGRTLQASMSLEP
jgi:hypothetical protein